MNTELDTFESKLLADLRDVVDERAAALAAHGRTQRRIRWSVAAATALITLGGSGILALNQSPPAYAVAPHDDGSVTVTINRLEQGADLEAALARAGIRTDVTYTRPGYACAPGRFTPAVSPASSGGPANRPIRAEVTDKGAYTLTLPKNLLAKGQTLVLETSWTSDFWSLAVSVAEGAVGECRQVKADPMPLPADRPGDGSGPTTVEASGSPAPSPSR